MFHVFYAYPVQRHEMTFPPLVLVLFLKCNVGNLNQTMSTRTTEVKFLEENPSVITPNVFDVS